MSHRIRVQFHQPQVCDDVDRAIGTLHVVGQIPRSLARGLYNATSQGSMLGFEINPHANRIEAEMQLAYLKAAGWLCEIID